MVTYTKQGALTRRKLMRLLDSSLESLKGMEMDIKILRQQTNKARKHLKDKKPLNLNKALTTTVRDFNKLVTVENKLSKLK